MVQFVFFLVVVGTSPGMAKKIDFWNRQFSREIQKVERANYIRSSENGLMTLGSAKVLKMIEIDRFSLCISMLIIWRS